MGNADEDSGEDSNEDSEEEADTIIEAVTVPEYATIPSLHDIKSSKPPSPECHYDDAVLQACQQTHESDESKRKTLYILDSLQLSPLVVTDALGMEQNALAHPSVISKLSSGSISVRPIIPTKRKSDGELCPNCSPLVAPGLEHLLAVSPYTAILLKRKYVEIPSSICDLLNEDWTFRPQLRYACAQILAGCIMLNSNNGKAIIANTVEMYGRTRPLDAHREPFGVKKGVPIPTSLPPSTNTRYKDVWPLTITASEGERLVIGTQSCNALITSSLRLDSKEPATVGATNLSFMLSTTKDSMATRIYLDEDSIEEALAIARRKDAWSISNRNIPFQIRQLKTKFSDASTYLLCRASGHITRSHTCQPYTLSTLIYFGQSQNGDGVAAATLFNELSKKVLEAGPEAELTKSTVQKLRQRCSENGHIAKEFDHILAVYPENEPSVTILGNHQFDSHLEKLAQLLSSYIATANKSTQSFIQHAFSSSG